MAEIHEGKFTIQRGAKHATLRIRFLTVKEREGLRYPYDTAVGYLRGPDNENDYTEFAFICTKNQRYSVFSKYRGSEPLIFALQTLLGDPKTAGIAYAMRSGRCCRCGRLLTVPSSIHAGMGAVCASRGGF